MKQITHVASVALVMFVVLLVAVVVPGFGASAQQTLPFWTELSSASGDLAVPTGGSQQTALLSGDLDNDGDVDLVVGSRLSTNSVIWYQRSGTAWTILPVEADGLRIEAGGAVYDVDSDGLLDIVMGGDFQSSEIWWWKNPGPGGWATAWQRFTAKSGGDTKHHGMGFGDFDNDGQVELAYWNQGAGNSANDLYIADVPADPTTVTDWPTQLVFDATTPSEGLDIADIDGDGDDDIVAGGNIIDDGPGGIYTVAPVNGAEADYLWAAGDLIKGGRLELVSSSGDSVGGLALYTWNGTGWVRSDLLDGLIVGPWDRGHSLDIGDVNGDGYLDIFSAEMSLNAGSGARSVVLYGDGIGGFEPDTVSTGIDNHESLLVDLDGDGDVDIASKAFNQATPSIRFYTNAYDAATIGPWARREIATRSGRASWIRSGDLNGDGRPDLVSGNSWQENPGTIDGNWTERTFDTPLTDAQLVLDLDGDGDLDVFGYERVGSGKFSWAENDGTGGFTTRTNIPNIEGDFPQGVTVKQTAGGPEIWIAWNNRVFGIDRVVVPADPISGTWTVEHTNRPSQGEEIEWVDVDRDGDLDLLQGHMWSRNEGNDTYTDFTLFSPTRCCFEGVPGDLDQLPDRIVSADINGDGRLDVVVTHEYDPTSSVAWFEQPLDPTQLWTKRIILEADLALHSLDAADLDGDGDLDLVTAEHDATGNNAGKVMILQNLSGNGRVWGTSVVYDGESNHDGTDFADLDGDGDLDIYTIGWRHNRVVVHENLGTGPTTPVWHDADRRYRIDIELGAPTAAVVDQPATALLNFSEALTSAGGLGSVNIDALRVVEVDTAAQLLDATVPFQFDAGPEFDANGFATGELVLLMTGETAPGAMRRYQVYFDVVGSAATPIAVVPSITTTQGVVDGGLSTTRIVTQAGTWYYDTAGGGFSSLDDSAGNDWIGYSSANGAAGEFRGIPNLVAPADGGYLHPGSMSAATVVTRSGPIRTTIESTVPGTGWSMRWEIYPKWATGTVTGADGKYWFQYEGTPGGTLSAADTIHRSGAASLGALESFSGDLVDPEWIAATDPRVGRTLLVTQLGPDTAVDSYRDQDDLMTVMAFGRPANTITPLLGGAGRAFSVGLIDDVSSAGVNAAAAAYRFSPTSMVTRSISATGVTGPGGGWDGGGPIGPPPTTTTFPSATMTSP